MNRFLVSIVAVCGLLGLVATQAVIGNSAVEGDEPAMMASPQTIVLEKVDSVTVHTNIPAATVDRSTVALNGVAPVGTGADSLGHLVARFALADLALTPGEATLILTGLYLDGDGGFAASDVVTVK
jgi:hypothetical protein